MRNGTIPDIFLGKRGLVLGLALLSSAGAAYMMRSAMHVSAPPAPVVASAPVETTGVLVARADIPLGKKIGPEDLSWQPWPTKSLSPQFIKQTDRGGAVAQLTGSIARSSFVKGEPISEAKLSHLQGAGYLASLLPAGERATAIDIVPNTSVNGFVLPGDHVDVMLVSSEKHNLTEFFTGETVVRDVQVLAIDDKYGSAGPGNNVLHGKIATLALTPREAEALAVAQRVGSLSLILRSAAEDADPKQSRGACDARIGERQAVSVFRYGVEANSITASPAC